jgi:hypothetical protein
VELEVKRRRLTLPDFGDRDVTRPRASWDSAMGACIGRTASYPLAQVRPAGHLGRSPVHEDATSRAEFAVPEQRLPVGGDLI